MPPVLPGVRSRGEAESANGGVLVAVVETFVVQWSQVLDSPLVRRLYLNAGRCSRFLLNLGLIVPVVSLAGVGECGFSSDCSAVKPRSLFGVGKSGRRLDLTA
jgi:hypothetical protein